MKLREQSQGADKRYQFGTAVEENLNFGIGSQACPGRFFAANEIKLMFVKRLLGWDVVWGEAGPVERPIHGYQNISVITPNARMLARRRKK